MNLVLWVVVFFLVSAEAAHAGPAIAGILAFAATPLGGIIVNLVIGLATTLVSGLISNLFKPKAAETKQPGLKVQLQVGGNNPLEFPLGPCATAGNRAYYGSWGEVDGTPNAYFVDVIKVSDMITAGWTGFWLYDERVTVLTGETKQPQGWPILEYRRDGVDYAWFDFFDGTQTTANPYLVDKFGSHPSYPWTSNMVGVGQSYFTITARLKRGIIDKTPNCLLEVQSIPLYDIRKDTTAGGSGPHRWGNLATYEPSANKIVQAYNVARGIYLDDEWIYGGQNWPAFRLPASSWMAAMNACDLAIALEGGGTEPQFHGGGVVTCDIVPATTIEELLRGCSGLIAETGGVFKVRVGAPGAPVFSFTDANIVVTRQLGYRPYPGNEETYNIAQALYAEPTSRWTMIDAPEMRFSELIEDDGEELPFQVDLPWTQSNTTVQRILQAALLASRRFRSHVMGLGPEAWVLEPMDVVSWTSEHANYIDKEFELDQISGEFSFIQTVNIRETDPSDYDWDAVTDERPFQYFPLVTIRPTPQPATGVDFFPYSILDGDGIPRRPSIEATWVAGLEDVRAIHIQIRLLSTGVFAYNSEIPYDPEAVPGTWLDAVFLPNEIYECRLVYLPYSPRLTYWSNQDPITGVDGPWDQVLTPDIKLVPGKDFDPFAGVVGFDDLDTDLDGYQDWMGLNMRELWEEIEANAVATAGQELANAMQFNEMRRAVAVSVGALSATFEETITVMIAPVNGQLVAIADALTQLSAGEGSDVSTARFRLTAMSGPTGYARIGAETRVDAIDPDDWRGAAWYLDTPTNPALPTRFLVDADQFVFIVSGSLENPFIVDGGGLRVNNALVKTASIGDAQITAAKIADANITRAKIENAAIGEAQIDTAAITNAKIANGAITNAKLGTAVIQTANIVSGNVSETFSSVTDGTINCPDSGSTTVESLTINAPVGSVIVTAMCYVNMNGGSSYQLNLFRNGVQIGASRIFNTFDGYGLKAFTYRDVAPGNVTYSMRVVGTGGGAATGVSARSIIATNNKV